MAIAPDLLHSVALVVLTLLFGTALSVASYAVAVRPFLGRRHRADDLMGWVGHDGLDALTAAFARDAIRVRQQTTVPSGANDVATQVLAQWRAGVTALVVWASAPVVAAVVQAARSGGRQVPIWTGPSGEDPLVRQRLARHPDWLTGVGFASFRITAEVGAAPLAAYRKAYVRAFGELKVRVRQKGKDVVQPPDWSMFSYDAVNLVVAALNKSGATGTPLLDTLAFVCSPVTNDLLSQNLPTVPQTL